MAARLSAIWDDTLSNPKMATRLSAQLSEGVKMPVNMTPPFETFLQANKRCPAISLAHAGIGDDGCLQVAQFLSDGDCAVCDLDLSGNQITSIGLEHLSNALQMKTAVPPLRSLVLRFNGIGEDDGLEGLQTLCRALRDNETLQHLDLRHNEIRGSQAAARCLAELISHNNTITHLELSWNPIGVETGHALLAAVHRNTALVDLQLSGCGMASETLLEIAGRLTRNAKVKSHGTPLGPWQGKQPLPTQSLPEVPTWVPPNPELLLAEKAKPWPDEETAATAGQTSEAAPPDLSVRSSWGEYEAPDLSVQEKFGERSLFKNMIFGEPDLADLAHMPAPNLVSDTSMQEMMQKIMHWQSKEGLASEDRARALELYEYIASSQKQLALDQKAALDLQEHTRLLQQGFRDREDRAKAEIRQRRHRLQEMEKEKGDLEQVFRNVARSLNRLREEKDDIVREQEKEKEQYASEEENYKIELARVMTHGRILRRRVEELEEQSTFLQEENERVQERARSLRGDILRVETMKIS